MVSAACEPVRASRLKPSKRDFFMHEGFEGRDHFVDPRPPISVPVVISRIRFDMLYGSEPNLTVFSWTFICGVRLRVRKLTLKPANSLRAVSNRCGKCEEVSMATILSTDKRKFSYIRLTAGLFMCFFYRSRQALWCPEVVLQTQCILRLSDIDLIYHVGALCIGNRPYWWV